MSEDLRSCVTCGWRLPKDDMFDTADGWACEPCAETRAALHFIERAITKANQRLLEMLVERMNQRPCPMCSACGEITMDLDDDHLCPGCAEMKRAEEEKP